MTGLERSDHGTAARARLAAARLYLVAPPMDGEWLRRVLSAGVDVVQLRAKDAEARQVLAAGRAFADAAREAGVPFVVNDRPDIAYALDADGVHLGQDDLPPAYARELLGPHAIVGRSTHSPQDIERALAEHERGLVDYIAVGPVHETPTKPGRPSVGLALVRHAADVVPPDLPWFGIGGIDPHTIGDVVHAGASRVVVVRAITEAAEPAQVVRALREALGPP